MGTALTRVRISIVNHAGWDTEAGPVGECSSCWEKDVQLEVEGKRFPLQTVEATGLMEEALVQKGFDAGELRTQSSLSA